jgi:hypothetical protein
MFSGENDLTGEVVEWVQETSEVAADIKRKAQHLIGGFVETMDSIIEVAAKRRKERDH